MKYSILFLIIVLSFNTFSFAQSKDDVVPETSLISDFKPVVSPVPFAKTITSENLKNHLTILSSDEFEGRETGTEGNEKAAKKLNQQFHMYGMHEAKRGA